MRFLFALFIALASFPAMAKQYHAGPCGPKAAYAPSNDIDYVPGVDARGKPVAPVETAPPALTSEDMKKVDIDIGLPLSDYTHTPPFGDESAQSGIYIGTVGVEGSDVTLSGKSLKNEDTDRYIREGCPPDNQ